MKAIILAGGFGTRLKDIIGDVPKPMASIVGKPFLEHQIRFLKDGSVSDIILAVHYMSDKIKSYFGAGHRWGVEVTYSEEEIPLGTGGAIKNAQKYVDGTFFVLNGDTYSKLDLTKFVEFHRSRKSNFTIGLASSKNPLHYGSVILEGDKIIDFSEKKDVKSTLINRGIYIFDPKIFDYIEKNKNVSLEKQIFPQLAKEGLLFGYECGAYFMDIGRPETYQKFKSDMLENTFLTKWNKVRDAIGKIHANELDLVLVIDNEEKLSGVLTDRIIKRYILKGGSLDDRVEEAMISDPVVANVNDDSQKRSKLLLSGINHLPIVDNLGKIVDVDFRVEHIKTEKYPIVRGRSPLRISFAGGGTDLSYFFEKYGGVVISATIDKYCHATVIKRADSKIIIKSDVGEETVFGSKDKLAYDGRFDLVKAVISNVNPEYGLEIYLRNDVLPGMGLGSSASLAVLLIKILSSLNNSNYDDYTLAELAYKVEREELKIIGGWQDQYAAARGGFNFMEFKKDGNLIYPLGPKEEIINELNERLLLCNVGRPHFSGEIHKKQEEAFNKNEDKFVSQLNELKNIAVKIKDCLLTNRLDEIGRLLHESWEIKKKLSENTNQNIDELYTIGLKNGACGGKLLGAGNGGYLLFYHEPKKRNQLTRALIDKGGGILDFNFEFKGTQVWLASHNV